MKIKIVNTAYKVVFASHEECDDRDVWGWVDFPSHTIFIDSGASIERQQETLWHEIIHCFFEEYKFPLRQPEEVMTAWLGKSISEFITRNRKFVREYLT